jgi:hypothetical protein
MCSSHKLVWEETVSTYRQMTEAECWDLTGEVTMPAVNDITTKVCFMMFGTPVDHC